MEKLLSCSCGYDHVDDHDDGALLLDDVNLYNGADGYDHDDDHDDGALLLDDAALRGVRDDAGAAPRKFRPAYI